VTRYGGYSRSNLTSHHCVTLFRVTLHRVTLYRVTIYQASSGGLTFLNIPSSVKS
jgi:hypothetical protein